MNSLEDLAHGRIDAFHLTPETGLVVLSIWCPGGPQRLAVAVGPRLLGVGVAPGVPSVVADAKHPLVAAARAHLVGQRVRSVALDDDDGAVWVTVGAESVSARMRLFSGVSGEVKIVGPAGETVLAWRPEGKRSPWTESPSGALDLVGRELLRLSDALALELRRGALASAVRAQHKRMVRREEAVRSDLARVGDRGKLQRIGRMLLAQGAKVARGVARCTLDDWEEGGTLEVALDPARPAKAQAEGFFREARRIARGEGLMRERLATTELTLAGLRALEEDIELAEAFTHDDLAAWTARARALGVVLHAAHGGRKKGAQAPRQPFIEYAASGGQRVLVGRGAKDNDALTLKVARPQDLWMHARGVPGAHVVVPLQKGAQCGPEALIDAATLAAHHSDARGETTVEVTWTERRYVRKGRKMPAGKVTLDRERVMALRVEAARLQRLLAARCEG